MEDYKVDPTIAYDVVELPSKGIYYPTKKKSLRVAYLTACDENILSSPNLIANNGIIDELLRNKILDKDIDVTDIVEQDRQAILIFLRNTAWGCDYKMSLIDPKTNNPFEINIDLSTVSIKDFKLEEDLNGEYRFYLEKSKVEITFKFLTKKQEDEIRKIGDSWNGNGIPPIKSKELESMIKSVGGNRSMMEIHNFVERMPIKDSQDFRKFVNENKPGLDLTQKVNTPSGEEIEVEIGLGLEFFRPFYGL